MLHEHGTVWADAKPDDFVVDLESMWWLNFGGGLTDGWVEPSVFHTEEGSLRAAAKMKEGLVGGLN